VRLDQHAPRFRLRDESAELEPATEDAHRDPDHRAFADAALLDGQAGELLRQDPWMAVMGPLKRYESPDAAFARVLAVFLVGHKEFRLRSESRARPTLNLSSRGRTA
jgi:hypothetical protein